MFFFTFSQIKWRREKVFFLSRLNIWLILAWKCSIEKNTVLLLEFTWVLWLLSEDPWEDLEPRFGFSSVLWRRVVSPKRDWSSRRRFSCSDPVHVWIPSGGRRIWNSLSEEMSDELDPILCPLDDVWLPLSEALGICHLSFIYKNIRDPL